MSLLVAAFTIFIACQPNQTTPDSASGKIKTLQIIDSNFLSSNIDYEFIYNKEGVLVEIQKNKSDYIHVSPLGDTAYKISRKKDDGIIEYHNIHYNTQRQVTYIDLQTDTIIDDSLYTFLLPSIVYTYSSSGIIDSMYEYASPNPFDMMFIESNLFNFHNQNCASYSYHFYSYLSPTAGSANRVFSYDTLPYSVFVPNQEIVVSPTAYTFQTNDAITLTYISGILGLMPGYFNSNLFGNGNINGIFDYTYLLDNNNRVISLVFKNNISPNLTNRRYNIEYY